MCCIGSKWCARRRADLLNTKPEWKHLIRSEGPSTLDPAAAQSSSGSPLPLACVCVCVCVCVFGGWVLREHLEQELCAVFSGPDGPLGGNASMDLQIQTHFNKDVHLCCIYVHTPVISVTRAGRPWLRTHTHTHTHRQFISCCWGDVLQPH